MERKIQLIWCACTKLGQFRKEVLQKKARCRAGLKGGVFVIKR